MHVHIHSCCTTSLWCTLAAEWWPVNWWECSVPNITHKAMDLMNVSIKPSSGSYWSSSKGIEWVRSPSRCYFLLISNFLTGPDKSFYLVFRWQINLPVKSNMKPKGDMHCQVGWSVYLLSWITTLCHERNPLQEQKVHAQTSDENSPPLEPRRRKTKKNPWKEHLWVYYKVQCKCRLPNNRKEI